MGGGITLYIAGAFLIVIVLGMIIVSARSKAKEKGKNTVKTKGGGKQSAGKSSSSKGNTKTAVVPKSVKDSIPYVHTYDGGIIETSPGVYTSAFKIADVNFKIASGDEQTSIFIKFGRFLNSFATDAQFQILIENKTADLETVFNNINFAPQNDDLNVYRREMNNIFLDKMQEGKNNISQSKYLVVSIKSTDFVSAERELKKIGETLNKRLCEISREYPPLPLNITERLHSLYDIYNQDKEGTFYNSKDKKGLSVFDASMTLRMGVSTKDIVGPASMDFSASSYFQLGGTYGRTLYLENFPNWLSSEFLSDITDTTFNMAVSLHYQPIEQSKALKVVHNLMLNIDGQIADTQKRAGQQGYSIDLVSPTLIKQQKYARDLIDDMVSRDQKMFFVTLLITVFGETKEELEDNTKSIINTANNHMCSFKTLYFQQEHGLNACLPLCINTLHVSKMLTTESAAIFIPYTTQELHQRNGIYYGLNDTSKNMIVHNRLLGENYNGLIIGESGNGKSFAAKQEMISVLLRDPRSVVYVIDPESEYSPLAKELGGQVIDLSPNSKSYINPLDLSVEYDSDADPISLKTEFIISMIEIMVGNGRVATPEEKSIISRCVQKIYRPYLDALDDARRAGQDITADANAAPTLQTLYNMVLIQPEPAARGLASVLEMYSTGTLATFAHRTNVDTSSRFVVYDIKNLGAGTKDLGLHICLNNIWNKMMENRTKDIYTWVYIDEFYLLLQTESSAKFLASLWKRARKFNGVPTGILQNTEDLIKSDDSRAILNNSSFVQIFSLKKIDRANIKNLLNLSDAQLTNITDAGPGRGLIYANKTVLPFDNQFPETTKLYSVMSTSGTKDKAKRQVKFVQ